MWGRRLQADWMTSLNPHGKEEEINLRRCRLVAYLEEARQWNIDGNFDRISANNMTFILRAAKLKYLEGTKANAQDNSDPYADDPFFRDNPSFEDLQNDFSIKTNEDIDVFSPIKDLFENI